MSIKVLVADDSITIQKVIGIIFGGDEYSLTVVDNGKTAVEKAREINPDILLIDALMPGMTGYEVAEMVRSTPSLANKPILILTGSFEPFDEEKAKKCGADDYIAKPFESQQIITKVKELLELGSSRQTSQVSSSEPLPITVSNQAPEVSATIFDMKPEVPEPVVPSDIWGAFTPEAEVPPPLTVAPTVAATFATPSDPRESDVFAIVSEEDDSQLIQTTTPANTSPQHTGSQWIPVEENTFEFEEETIAEPPLAAFAEQAVSVQETSFGDIAFDNEISTRPVTAFTAVPEQVFTPPEPEFTAPAPNFADFAESTPEFETPAAPFEPLLDPTPTYTVPAEPALAAPVIAAPDAVTIIPAVLTEEQLKTALTGVSKEVIERIVWEVVPDLAEALIREAIRKIKEGV